MKDILLIKEIAKAYKQKNGNKHITNKELLWFMISKFDTLENRVTKTETKVNLFMWAVPICIAITAILIRII